ncbi:MAG: Rpn family recombination-promoting nuclease/putative transposase [Lachnospiraceae bacterium]|nr:Rpn family recombination-promoting nuclease/putative transposase [Lachnospiraceae bacterium]
MGQKDISQKILEDYNDVFADIVNVLIFQGKQVVKPEELEDTKLRSQYKADDTKLHEQERDIAKLWKKGGVLFTVCGIENQTTIDEDMPLRVIGYDGASYRKQLLDQKNKRRYPVMTLVLYYGKKHWETPRTLKERIDVPENLKDFISDYQMNIFEIAYLSEEQISMFQSDYQIAADYFVQTRKGKRYHQNTKIMKHVDAMLKFLSVFAQDEDYLKVDLSKERQEGGVSMCEVLQEVKQFGIREGIERGRQEGINLGRQEGENKLARLMKYLLVSGKNEEAIRATTDEEYRKELYHQFRIIE